MERTDETVPRRQLSRTRRIVSHVLMSMSIWGAMFQLDPSTRIQYPYVRWTCPPHQCPGGCLEALRLLDEVDLALIFRRGAVVMKTVPRFMLGVQEVTTTRLGCDERRHTRALFRPPRGGLIPKTWLEERLRSVRPRRLPSVVGSKRGSRCSGLRTSAQERRK